MRRDHVLVVGWAVVMLFAACGPTATANTSQTSATTTAADTTPTPATACQALTKVQSMLAKLSTVGVNTTVGEVERFEQQVDTAVNALNQHFAGSTSDALNALNSAHDKLATKVATFEHLPATTPMSQAAPNLADFHTKVVQFQTTATNLSVRLKC
jgi:hypothetical protein